MDLMKLNIKLEGVCKAGIVKVCYNCKEYPALRLDENNHLHLECPNCKWDDHEVVTDLDMEDEAVADRELGLMVEMWNRHN